MNDIPHHPIPQTIQTLTAGLAALPLASCSRPIQHFLREYLGTPRQPAPFGGRSAQLATLDAWLTNPEATPYGLLIAEAGRGKSALLVQWLHQPHTRQQAEVIFLPISLRFGTARAETLFTALAAHLAHLHSEALPITTLGADQARRLCQSYLVRPLPDGRPLLIVLDGLDEAADWSPDPDLFPRRPPPGLRVLLAARPLPGPTPDHAWRAALGWHAPTLATTLPLTPLDREGLIQVLALMGHPLDQLATRIDLTAELFRLTQGDPLLVRLYVEALHAHPDHPATLAPDALPHLAPGLSGYFDRWWHEQHSQWAAQGRDPLVQRDGVQAFCELLACALGPLTHADIAAIMSQGPLTDPTTLASMAADLGRFVIGDGQVQGYTFAHPRLAYHFWDAMPPEQRTAWEQRFLAYGQRTLEALNTGALAPTAAPAYALQSYGAHLERAHAPLEAHAALISEGWLRAWEACEGTHAGFLTDAARAWAAADRLLTPDHPPATRVQALGVAILAALCHASVASLSANIPPDLLALALQNKVLSPTQALTIARHTPAQERTFVRYTPDDQRREALAAIAPHLPPALHPELLAIIATFQYETGRAMALGALAPYLSATLLAEAIATARAIQDEGARAIALGALAPHLEDSARLAVLAEAVALMSATPDATQRVHALEVLAPHLSSDLLPQALATACAFQNEWLQAQALRILAPSLKGALLVQALEVAHKFKDIGCWTDVVRALAPQMNPAQLTKALDTARTIQYAGCRAEALGALAPHLDDAIGQALLAEALDAVPTIELEENQAKALGVLAPHLSETLLAQALELTQAIQDDEYRTDALSTLIPHLSETLLAQACEIARAIQDEDLQCEALRVLALKASETERPAILAEALQVARTIHRHATRARALTALAPQLSDTERPIVLVETLTVARTIQDGHQQADVLKSLGRYLQKSLLGEALGVARAIQDPKGRTDALVALAPWLNDQERLTVLVEALSTARAIHDEWQRAGALRVLAPHLSAEILPVALDIVSSIYTEWWWVGALNDLAPYLNEETLAQALRRVDTSLSEAKQAQILITLMPHLSEAIRPAVLVQTLGMARTIQDEKQRARALGSLALKVSEIVRPSVLAEALEAAHAIQDAKDRITILASLVPQLGTAERHAVLTEVWSAIRPHEDEQWRFAVLREIAPYLNREMMTEALDMARTFQARQTDVLNMLAPHLSEELLHKGVDAVRAIQSEWGQAYSLSALIPRLSGALLTEALAISRAIQDAQSRAEVLRVLVHQVSETERPALLAEALTTARAIHSDPGRAAILGELATQMSDTGQSVLTEALMAVRAIQEEQGRANALASLVRQFPTTSHPTLVVEALDVVGTCVDTFEALGALCVLAPHLVTLAETHPQLGFPAWRAALHTLGTTPRHRCLAALAILLPFPALVRKEAAPEAAEAIMRALRNASTWWA